MMAAAAQAEVVDLVSSDEENELPNVHKRRSVASSVWKQTKKRVKTEDGHAVICLDLSDSEDDAVAPQAAAACLDPRKSTVSEFQSEEEDIVEVAAPVAPTMNQGKSDKNEEESKQEDDDVAIVGATGPNALADFPHSRENCVTHPHAQDPARHCPNCYCYVCDKLASSCPAWQTHCRATHGDKKWRKMREDVRKNGGAIVPAPAPAVRRTTTTVTNPPPPPPLDVSGRPDLDEYSLRALLQAITTVHPVEISPPAGVFTTNLRHYQKQSVAFMREEERRRREAHEIRGGWLCDELGMVSIGTLHNLRVSNMYVLCHFLLSLLCAPSMQGKSAVVLALIAANPMKSQKCPSLERIRSYPTKGKKKLKVKTTVILTSVSLLGQWEDECRKHAPGLKVARYHGRKRVTVEDLHSLDVIISSSTFNWNTELTGAFKFHRVVVDESHLFATAAASAKISIAMRKHSTFRWCVTATPCVSSAADLKKQLMFLNSGGRFSRFESLQAAAFRFTRLTKRSTESSKKQAFYGLMDEMKTCMIRHTKSQRIHGSEALALPESTTTTVYLNMSVQERAWFAQSVSSGVLQSMERFGARALNVERTLTSYMYGVASQRASELTKIKALRQDLRQLRVTEPSFRVVVYTQSLSMQDIVLKALQRDRITTLQFNGSTNATKRDKVIRQFQNEADKNPAVFVITLRSGNVGITLTAASRVYLMEPSLDPAAEVQAAGRIHRLGQTKAVEVKKMVFANSIESNIVDLHKEIVAGRISVSDGFYPPEAIKVLAKNIRTNA